MNSVHGYIVCLRVLEWLSAAGQIRGFQDQCNSHEAMRWPEFIYTYIYISSQNGELYIHIIYTLVLKIENYTHLYSVYI